jgi:hypothetical protein
MLNNLREIVTDAWAYMSDPSARMRSSFTYPSGAPMSVRAAKMSGLMDEQNDADTRTAQRP